MRKNKINRGPWRVEVKYVPFESESKRDFAYMQWARAFILGKKEEIRKQKNRES